MRVNSFLMTDYDAYTTVRYGIKGKHWDINEWGFPEQFPEFLGREAHRQIGVGYWWESLFIFTPLTLDWMRPKQRRALQVRW